MLASQPQFGDIAVILPFKTNCRRHARTCLQEIPSLLPWCQTLSPEKQEMDMYAEHSQLENLPCSGMTAWLRESHAPSLAARDLCPLLSAISE